MRIAGSSSEGSWTHDEMILALVAAKVPVAHQGAGTYLLTDPEDGVPFVFPLPKVLTPRTVQRLLENFAQTTVNSILEQMLERRRQRG